MCDGDDQTHASTHAQSHESLHAKKMHVTEHAEPTRESGKEGETKHMLEQYLKIMTSNIYVYT